MNPSIRTRPSELLIVFILVASEGHLRSRGAEPGGPAGDNSGKPAGGVGLHSLERVPMAEVFFQAKVDGGGSKSAESRDAIVGVGFFEIQMPDGVQAFTRNGAFKVASDGLVKTGDGFPLISGIGLIPTGSTGVIVTAFGAVFVTSASGGSFGSSRIFLVRFQNPAGLKPIGSDIFLESEASGPPETGNAGENGFGEIGPGFLRLPGSFGFTTQLGPARSWIDVEISQDAKTWTVLASGLSSNGEKLFVRDIRAADFAHRFYRVRSRPSPIPPVAGQ